MNDRMNSLGTRLLPRSRTWGLKGIHAALLALMTLVSVPLVEAADGKRVAFVVGIGKYDNLADDKQLKNSVNDAEGVSAKLTEIGFHVTQAPNLKRSDFNEKWQAVLDSLSAEDTFVLFYSGHGVQIEGENYLLPRDIPFIEYGKPERLKRESISVNELLSELTTGGRPHPKRAVVILDACRDNPLIPPGYKSIKASSGLAKPSSTEGLFVIYSSLENSISLDRLPSDGKTVKYSVFTRVLLPLLGRQDLTLQNLSLKLKHEVSSLARNAGRRQLPTYYDGTDGEPFCLPGCADKAEKESVKLKENRLLALDLDPALLKKIRPAPVVLILAGSFQMGSTKDEVGRAIQTCLAADKHYQQTCEGLYKPEFPQHRVQLDAFYLDKYEVTNLRFQQFVDATRYQTTAEQEGYTFVFTATDKVELVSWLQWREPERLGEKVFASNREDHPVVSVSWDDAQAYCRWAGKRLPTEAEFEYATRAGTESTYWWGNGNPGSRRVDNIADESLKRSVSGASDIMTGYDDEYIRTAPVGSFEANPFGLHDMIGNVSEWTADWYDETYYQNSPERNPKGPSSGQARVIRGGSWVGGPGHVRSATRGGGTPTARVNAVGFRCAQDFLK
jgi:formylglycine-generating enzyme